MSANDEFIQDPILFFSKNIVRVAYGNMDILDIGGLAKFTLKKADDGSLAFSFFGDPIGFYYLADGTKDSSAFDGYWCPFRHDSICSTTLWNKADFMFTANMTGCTFAIGTAGEGGSVLVGHANSISQGSNQAKSQRHLAKNFFQDKLSKLFKPKHYREKPNETDLFDSTTIGVRDTKTGKWSFYAQVYQFEGGMEQRATLRSIKKIA